MTGAMRPGVPSVRVTPANDAPVRPERDYVLYWMTAYRRLRSNFALQRAGEHARELRRPLLILEALRCDYPWASDRLHAFVLEGMAHNARAAERAGVRYAGYVEPARGAGKGLLSALARRAAVVVTDDFPTSFHPRMTAAAARALDVRLEAIDAAGLIPFRLAGRAFPTAAVFRRHLQRALPGALAEAPVDDALAGLARLGRAAVDDSVLVRWPMGVPDAAVVSQLPIDHGVPAVATLRGGSAAAAQRLEAFVAAPIDRYADRRQEPLSGGTSGLSPYLHFGHIGTHEVLAAVAARYGWSPDRLGAPTGAREGFWGVPAGAEAFLDQLVVWRELGLGFCAHRKDHDRISALPAWAARTLEQHARDPRPWTYTLEELEEARTHDEVWNAAQRQLVQTGEMHNYLRMLWGKKVLEWSPDPRRGIEWLVHLNNRYAIDGRDPNSYTGILWCFGAFDRPWAPERPVFGSVRYMSSENTKRKLRLREYLRRFGPAPVMMSERRDS
jgi:deoxyribodipyrimidine photo-lyase